MTYSWSFGFEPKPAPRHANLSGWGAFAKATNQPRRGWVPSADLVEDTGTRHRAVAKYRDGPASEPFAVS